MGGSRGQGHTTWARSQLSTSRFSLGYPTDHIAVPYHAPPHASSRMLLCNRFQCIAIAKTAMCAPTPRAANDGAHCQLPQRFRFLCSRRAVLRAILWIASTIYKSAVGWLAKPWRRPLTSNALRQQRRRAVRRAAMAVGGKSARATQVIFVRVPGQ